jgi:hypothetical protein
MSNPLYPKRLASPDGLTFTPVVYVENINGSGNGGNGGNGGEGGADRELVVSTYLAKNAFADASVGDTITATQVIDVTDVPFTVSTIWRNQSTGTDLGVAPDASDLELVGSTALTDAQLRAAALVVQGKYEDGPYTLDADGNLISETQINTQTGVSRTRAWTYATQPDGSVVATPGAWA